MGGRRGRRNPELDPELSPAAVAPNFPLKNRDLDVVLPFDESG